MIHVLVAVVLLVINTLHLRTEGLHYKCYNLTVVQEQKKVEEPLIYRDQNSFKLKEDFLWVPSRRGPKEKEADSMAAGPFIMVFSSITTGI